MGNNSIADFDSVELRPLIGLLANVPEPIVEYLTIEAIKTHRTLVDEAEALFETLPPEIRSRNQSGGPAHVAYLQAMIAMHAQMSALATLLTVLGRTPKI